MPAKGTYYKALLLFIVFSMNTVVSFACSFGGLFHGLHHNLASKASSHKHESKSHDHNAGHGHSPASPAEEHHNSSYSSLPTDDDCCSEKLIEVEKAEKSLSRMIEIPKAHFLNVFTAVSSGPFFYSPLAQTTPYPQHIRWRNPATILDLRIVIQSFQI